VEVTAGKDLTVRGSGIIGTGDVNLAAQGNVNITTAQERGAEQHYRYEKTSGIFGNGLGITIGSKSEKTTLDGQTAAQVGSTVGSLTGNVDITANKNVAVTGSNVISGQGTNIQGQNVTIEAAANTSSVRQTYEFKQSGLTVSLGGGAITPALNAAGEIRRASNGSDERLKALYEYKALQDIKKTADAVKEGAPLSLSVSIGSTKYSTETVSTSTSAQGSTVSAGGNVNIIATGSGAKDAAGKAADGNVNVVGSAVGGQNVNITAAKDINLVAADNTATSTTNTSSSSAGVGVKFDLSWNSLGMFVEGSKGSGNENENGTTHTQTVVTASDTLTVKSGSDMNIVGAQARGDTVKTEVGGNLNIASQQDTDTYHERTSSAGGTIGLGFGVSSSVSASKGKTDSTYASVTAQSGVYAGQGGFDINVGNNTDLKGAVIASDATPDKNKLSTGTLTWEDIDNRAEYSASSVGVNAGWGKDANGNPLPMNQQGLTPNIGVTASGNADSTTKSAIAPGTIEVRSNPNVDLSGLSRDTAGTLNALGKIFDKKTVQEKQELAKLFGELAYEEVGKLAIKNHWAEGSPEKVALHALVGGIMAELGGGSFASGATGAGLNQLVMNELKNIKDPALLQWASALVGAIASQLVGGDGQTGASTASSGTKNNYLNTRDKEQLINSVIDALKTKADKNQILTIIDTYLGIDAANQLQSPDMPGSISSGGWDKQLQDLLYVTFGYKWDASNSDGNNLSNLSQHLQSLSQIPTNINTDRLAEVYAKDPENFTQFLKYFGTGVIVVTIIGTAGEVALSGAALSEMVAAGEATLAVVGGKLTINQIGAAGEKVVRAVYDIGEKINIVVNGATRIPDGINRATKTLSEVKNVASLSYTQQLRDYVQWAQTNGYTVDLYVRTTTNLSGPLLEAINNGIINLKYIP
jgi:filamentous hemagglutinin